ncbi:MAG: DUF4351 domain-containing protein [Methylococcales bacterium]|nr:DUF4351 domain-containing protein [Methylococcales bacterium]
MLEHAFPEFMAFYFPDAHTQIDWNKSYEFKNTELRQVVRDAELGQRDADALVQVTLSTGLESWIYIHIEIQGQKDPDFARRMFTYNYRLFDRYARPIASLAVLADNDRPWKPDHYGFNVLGCSQQLTFPVAKLLEYEAEIDPLEKHANPFAIVTVAHLRTRQTKHDPESRYQAKHALVRLPYQQGWGKQRILDLFAVLDWMMQLPDWLEQQLWQDIQLIEGENQMPYVTSVERLATKRGIQKGMLRGMQQGMEQGRQQECLALVTRLLRRKFGSEQVLDDVLTQLSHYSLSELESLADALLDFDNIEDLHAWLIAH